MSSDNEDIGQNEEEQSSAEEEETQDQSDAEESGAEEPDINASATESDDDNEDDDDEVDDDKDIPPETKQKEKAPVSNSIAKITAAILERHKKRKGRQLYIRFSEKLPESMEEFQSKVKSLSSLIVEGHKPRQKHARFCLVDFATTEDRDKTLQELKKKDSKVFVSLPKTDDEQFIKDLIDKKTKQLEKKRAKNLLRKQNKKNVEQKQFTSTLMVLNIPKSATKAQIKELFPNAVDIQTKGATGKYNDKMIATVNLPSTEEARSNSKRKLSLGGNDLIIRFNNSTKKKNKQNKKKNSKKPKSGDNAKPKGPVAPEILESANKKSNSPKKPTQSPKKRSISENGSSDVPQKKAKVNKQAPNKKKKAKGNKDAPNKKANVAKNGKTNEKPQKKNKQKKKAT